MAIYKVLARGRNRYRVRYRDGANPNPKTRTFDTRAEAQEFEDAVRAAKRGGIQVPTQGTQTLAAFGAEYREKYANVELAPSTLAARRTLSNAHVIPRIGHYTLATLAHQPEILQSFKTELLTSGVGDASVAKTLATVSAVLGKAVEWNRIATNPTSGIRKPPQKRKRVIHPLAPAVVETLRAHMPTDDDKRLVSVLAYAGLRPGEALALHGSDVGRRAISVTKAISEGVEGDTKTGNDRSVPLLEPLAEDLRGVATGLIFPRPDGRPWTNHDTHNWRKRVWQPACDAAGVGTITTEVVGGKTRRSYDGPVPYDLRHSFASLLLAERRNPLEVAEIMGHSPQILLSTYAHVIAEQRGTTPLSAEEQIREARVKNVSQTQFA